MTLDNHKKNYGSICNAPTFDRMRLTPPSKASLLLCYAYSTTTIRIQNFTFPSYSARCPCSSLTLSYSVSQRYSYSQLLIPSYICSRPLLCTLRPQIVLGSSKGKLPNVWEGHLSQCFGRLWLCWPFPAIHGALGVSTLHGALFAHSSLEPRIGRAMAMTGRYVWTLPSTIL